MKQNYLKELMTALLLLCCTAASAADFEVDGIYYNILSSEDKTVMVTSGSNEYTGAVTIPASV
ncbi:MAG: leucine-rich repeat domain-containing protein, partial [Bacteroidaceae bacterium]|nr:leucine-rich repeat domain-containing protein [Bacteroidaceae bacterium]